MDFLLNEEQKMVRDMVRDFARNEVAPGVEEREVKGEFPADVIAKAAELGLCGIAVSEDFGGAGFDDISATVAIMELAAVCPSTAITLSVTNGVFCWPVEKFGTEEQKKKYLEPAASGEMLGGFCLTEPNAGSDASNISTKAIEDGDDFIINGTKAWVTNGGQCGAYVVMAATGDTDKGKEITAFIVPADSEGLSIGRVEDKMGLRASKTTQVVFENVRVSKENILHKRGKGLTVALATLDQSRIGVAAQACGIARGAYNEAVKYAGERTSFGKPLFKLQAIQNMLSDMAMRLEGAELLTLQAASMMDEGKPYGKAASQAKLYASEAANFIADKAVQVHGSYGYSKEYPVERFYRDARVTTIYEGTSEIQKMVIARHMIKELG